MKIKKLFLIVLLICWMVTVFRFSSEGGNESSGTSRETIKFLLDKLYLTNNMSDIEIEDLIELLQTPIRKLAHFSIYAVGGIISYSLANQYNIKLKKKIILSFGICLIYAITDEIHQAFIPGRSSQISDVLIDSLGALLGITMCNIKNIIKFKVNLINKE